MFEARPSEEVADPFTELLSEIDGHTDAVDEGRLALWRQRFDASWNNECEEWTKLVSLLPLPVDAPSQLADFDKLIVPVRDHIEIEGEVIPDWIPRSTCAAHDLKVSASRLAFLAAVACPRLADRYWKDQLGDDAIRFVAGCMNLLRLVAESQCDTVKARRSDCEQHIRQALQSYPITLTAVSLKHPQLVRASDDEVLWEYAPGNSLSTSLVGRHWPEIADLKNTIERSYYDDATTLLLRCCWIESEELSEAFRARDYRREKSTGALKLWAGYLVPQHAFEYCWRFLTAMTSQNKPMMGATPVERLRALDQVLTESVPPSHPRNYADWTSSEQWREAFVKLFRPVASLLELPHSYRYDPGRVEEAWVRQEEALEVLQEYPALRPLAARGILNFGHDHWDDLDPIVLGMAKAEMREILQEYLRQPQDDEPRYHARRLLAHAEGQLATSPPSPKDSSILSAVDTMIAVARTRVRDSRSQLWIGDAGIESLWLGALEAACEEFSAQFDTQFGQDEHEHAFLLADAISRWLSATNRTIEAWLSRQFSVPAFLNISVRRYPKTATPPHPQEGGVKGTQADLALLVNCDLPGLVVADRITLIQAKKIVRNGKGDWPTKVSLDKRQLARLITVSREAHYVFFAPSLIAHRPLVLPGRMVQHIVDAQTRGGLPLPLVLRAAKEFPAFALYDVIGLWAGDTSRKLIDTARTGVDVGQAPRVVVDIRITREREQ